MRASHELNITCTVTLLSVVTCGGLTLATNYESDVCKIQQMPCSKVKCLFTTYLATIICYSFSETTL